MSKKLLSGLLLPLCICAYFIPQPSHAQQKFNGIETNLGNLFKLSDAKSRSISAENFTGEKGKAAMADSGTGSAPAKELGRGWKISPSFDIKAKSIFTIAEIDGPGSIQHIWMTPTGNWRYSILRIYWDGEKEPSVECPVGDFFCMGWGKYSPLNSLPITVNPGSAFNCYFPMPFHKKCKITLENIDTREMTLYYQVDYILTEVPQDAAYFHAQFRRVKFIPENTPYVLLDNVKGRGQYVGTYIAFEAHHNGWWGEGEIKFYMDGDKDYPTICGTGTEDYFCGSYDFDTRSRNSIGIETSNYTEFCTPYAGLPQVIKGDGHYGITQRFGLYRWHITDPIRFDKDLKVTIQDLGWRSDGRYLTRQDEISSVVYWYQTEPHAPFPKFPTKDELEIF